MTEHIHLFILDTNNLNLKDVESNLIKFGLEVDSSIKTYKEKLFSQFIRHHVFAEFFKLSKLQFSINKSGKPYLKNYSDKHFSISHNSNLVVMAVANIDIGIDTEALRPRKNILKIAQRYFSKYEANILGKITNIEQQFYKLWTLKEAEVKRDGTGIAYGLADAIFTLKDDLWISENRPSDFISFMLNNAIISVCCKNLENLKIKTLKIDRNFNFKGIVLSKC